MRELQQILERAGFIAGGGLPINSFNFFEQWGERSTAYVQPARGRVAVPGWENADVAFGKDVPMAMISEAEELVRKYYKFRYFASVTVGGRRYWIMTLRRASAVYGFATGGAAPTPPTSDEWLWFNMPDGGTVTLTKTGTPTAVTLEYSLDNGSTWTEWVEIAGVRSLGLNAGQTMHVRNTSDTSTGFSTGGSNYYNFDFSAETYSGGNTYSLLCKNPQNAVITAYCFYQLFNGYNSSTRANLKTTSDYPDKPMANGSLELIYRNRTGLTESAYFASTTLAQECYYGAYSGCTGIIRAKVLPATTVAASAYYGMFNVCTKLREVTILATTFASGALTNWLNNVYATGDFYCPAELTIPTGASGIPTGWTRHDI